MALLSVFVCGSTVLKSTTWQCNQLTLASPVLGQVLYGKYDGTAVNYMGEDHQFIRDDNILFVYSGERMQPDTIKMIRDEILVKVWLWGGVGVVF